VSATLEKPAAKPHRAKWGADEDFKIGVLIHDVARMRRNRFDMMMKPMGLTRAQWSVIANLWRQDGMVQTELAELLEITKVTLGGLLDRLEMGDWIQRRPDSADRRAKRVYLTPNASRLLNQMRANEDEMNRIVFVGVSVEARGVLRDTLRRMRDNLRNETAS
jgi:DNA-binding MarR family transcriptional regulator